jgi:hypothetical protein
LRLCAIHEAKPGMRRPFAAALAQLRLVVKMNGCHPNRFGGPGWTFESIAAPACSAWSNRRRGLGGVDLQRSARRPWEENDANEF